MTTHVTTNEPASDRSLTPGIEQQGKAGWMGWVEGGLGGHRVGTGWAQGGLGVHGLGGLVDLFFMREKARSGASFLKVGLRLHADYRYLSA